MGLLDSVLGNLRGGVSGGASPLQGVLDNMLGGDAHTGIGDVAPDPRMTGGLSGLKSQFQQAGARAHRPELDWERSEPVCLTATAAKCARRRPGSDNGRSVPLGTP